MDRQLIRLSQRFKREGYHQVSFGNIQFLAMLKHVEKASAFDLAVLLEEDADATKNALNRLKKLMLIEVCEKEKITGSQWTRYIYQLSPAGRELLQ